MQTEVNCVDVLAPEGCVHDGWRERVSDWIPGNAVDPSGGIDRVNPVDAAQFLRSDLSGSSFFSRASGGEGEDTAGADSEHAAGDSLFAHAHADQRLVVAFATQKLDHGNIVGKSGGGADHFLEVGGECAHFFQRLFRLPGSPTT